ncbi:MAG: alpha/beta fold hydrolase [Acetobacter papayae]|uniref:alpha/beta fold hydrolase n=1 Tax=Acetobacter papayae TaxID=1076592 RepID=UPI0039ECD7C0
MSSRFLHLSFLRIRVSGGGWRALALLWVCALAGCAGPHPAGSTATAPVPPPRFAAAGRLVAPDRVFSLSDGARLPARVWSAQGAPRARLLALHGFNDSRDAWEAAGPVLAAQGITVIAPDVRGFGGTAERGRWPGHARLVADLGEEVAILKHEAPDTPLYLAGESMGGAIVMLFMAQPEAASVTGSVLLAPAIWNMGPGVQAPLAVMATLFPDHEVTGRELPGHIVAGDSLPAMIRLYYDPLTLHATRFDTLRGLVELMHEAAQAAPGVRGSVLCIYGDRDQIVPPAAIGRLWRATPGVIRRDLMPGGYHLLLRSRSAARTEADIAAWILNPHWFLPSGGDSAASAWMAAGFAWRDQAGPGGEALPWFLPARIDGLAR